MRHAHFSSTCVVFFKLKSSSIHPQSLAMTSGRPRESSVWDYFEFDEVENKSTCIVVVGDGQNQPANEPAKTCWIKIAGKYPPNLRKHLEKFHKEHQDMETKEKEKKKEEAKKQVSLSLKKNRSPTPTIESCLQIKKPYELGSPVYCSLMRKFVMFGATSSSPTSIVENKELRSFLSELNSRFPVPSRNWIGKCQSCLQSLRREFHLHCNEEK